MYQATENLVSYSKTQPAIFKTGQLSPVRDLKLLVKDYSVCRCLSIQPTLLVTHALQKPIAHSALTILINISADPEILESLAEDDLFLESIFNRITVGLPPIIHRSESSPEVLALIVIQNPKEANATLFAMLLSNLAKSDSFARLLDLKRPSVQTLSSTATNAFDQLLDLFNKGVSGSYNPTSKFEYLPYLFADLAKVRSMSCFASRSNLHRKT